MKAPDPISQPTVINTLADIYKVLEPYRQHHGDTEIKKRLLDGFKMLSKRQTIAEQINTTIQSAEFYGIRPAKFDPNQLSWLDRLITTKLGGKRVDNKIVWTINNQVHEYDPINGTFDGKIL